MSIFQNSFFSIAGQVERLTNVKNTLVSAITGKGVQANTSNETVNKVLSTVASNPFTSAFVVAGAKNPTALKEATKSGFSSLSGTGKAVVVGGAIAGASAIATNPKLIGSVAEAPKNLSSFASNVTNFASNPSVLSAKEVFSDNPFLTTGAVVGATYIVGKGTSSIISTALNTSAIKENTKATEQILNNTSSDNKFTTKIADIEQETQLKLAEMQNNTLLEIEKEKTKQLEYSSKQNVAVATNSELITPQALTPTKAKATAKKKKKTTKKKATKKKATKKKTTKKKKK